MVSLAGFLVGVVVAHGLGPADAVRDASTQVRVVDGQLSIQAAAGAANAITVTTRDRMLHVSDVVPLVPGTGCQPTAATQVICLADGVRSVHVLLGDGDDWADFDLTMPVGGDGGLGNDTVWSGDGPDTVQGGPGDDTIHGGGGNDTLKGGLDEDFLYGDSGDDTLHGDNAPSEPKCFWPCVDRLEGGPDDDYLAGGEHGDVLRGDSGTDTLDEPNSGNNGLDGGTGDDTITGAGPNMRDMVIYGDRVNDVGVNVSGVPYAGEAVLPAGTGGELAMDGTLAEHDVVTDVHWIRTGSGDDILIGPIYIDPYLDHGTGADQCDLNGNDGIVLSPCP